jgi:hypothetical protein
MQQRCAAPVCLSVVATRGFTRDCLRHNVMRVTLGRFRGSVRPKRTQPSGVPFVGNLVAWNTEPPRPIIGRGGSVVVLLISRGSRALRWPQCNADLVSMQVRGQSKARNILD